MQTVSVIRVLKLSIVPLAFCALAIGLLAMQLDQHAGTKPLDNAPPVQAAIEDPFSETQFSLSLKDLEIAASKGEIAAKLEVARRYAQGQGVERNDSRAIAYLQNITQYYWTIEPRDGRAFGIPEAFRMLAQYYRQGSEQAKLNPDPAQSERLLSYSAGYFGDAASQVDLARLILSGEAPTKNRLIAVHWLQNASRKGYAPAQALLGNMLWRGQGIKRVPGDGLGLLAVANRQVSPEDRAWVSEMYAAARAEATLSEVLEANAFIAQESSALRLPLKSDFLIPAETEPRPDSEPRNDVVSASKSTEKNELFAQDMASGKLSNRTPNTGVKPDLQQSAASPVRFLPDEASNLKTPPKQPLPQ